MRATIPTAILPLTLAALLAVACGGGSKPPATAASEPSPPAAASSDVTAADTASSAPVPDAQKTIGALRPQLRKCYDDALANDPKIEGAVKMVIKVDPDGKVTSALPAANATLAPNVIDCLGKVLQTAKFAPPGPSGATIEAPMTFRKSE